MYHRWNNQKLNKVNKMTLIMNAKLLPAKTCYSVTRSTYLSALVDLLLIILGDTVPGTQWLHSRVEVNGYEEFSGTEYRSAGWSEPYKVIE